MTALLASVRSEEEAFAAAAAGAELIDLKEPHDGALGGLPIERIGRIATTLRAQYPVKPLSATIGDVETEAFDEIAARVLDVSNAGVDYVKVGVTPGHAARRCLDELATLPAAVVPVLLCDGGLDGELVDHAASLGFVGIMFDTAGKDGRTLFDHVDEATLGRWLDVARKRGAMSGIAGSLGWAQLDRILALAPDVAGFRGALCVDGRRSAIDPGRVAKWAEALHRPAGTVGEAASQDDLRLSPRP
ncbi:(5-formylfuran-3-yl)methyl phosphate synthase [Trinickia sp. EG282A]|uniref:(5-formylfuran-3-yl)methyl phosphate synthase n=1 Tax=Trinickia sp. EG282A TaxID=3237013 RepID=UPI0034D29620